MSKTTIKRSDIEALFTALKHCGYRLVGPRVRDGAIVYDELSSASDLPKGWSDEQQGGTYRLKRRDDGALFGYTVGPHSWKKFLFPPTLHLWRAEKQEGSFEVHVEPEESPPLAFIGVRSCEIHALLIQDRIFQEGPYVDSHYKSRRDGVFIIALNCGEAGGTCFCVSMKTGPRATSGYDLALTEVLENSLHYFVAEAGTERGEEILRGIPHCDATTGEQESAERVIANTAAHMGRTMETEGIKELLYDNLDHPRWSDVASRCLTCGNCTLACPTCFCSTVEDTADLAGQKAERWRKWDSCFTMDHSFIHGGSVRATPRSRYRQWMTHKLATWIDQFGTSGCVGCGRCITWCPVAIDITEEVRAIRETSKNDSVQTMPLENS
jgi:sulfhydrogenase subunit beta (sulfur reductase)